MDFWKKYDHWLVFGISLLICTSFCGWYPIYILDEARNSEAAREMFISGDYIVPYFNGQLRTDKPPLHYFFMVIGYKIFGVNALGARFFSGLFGAFTLLVTYGSVKKNLGRQIAAFSFIVLLSSVFFIQEFHLSVPDPYLIFFISASLFCFYEFHETSKSKWLFFAYSCIGFGMMTKGPIALVLPGMVLTAFMLFKRQFNIKPILRFRPIIGSLLALLIALPWYYLVHKATDGQWTNGFFLDHNISRFNAGKEGHGGFFLITPLFVILGLLPFSVFIIQAFVIGWKKRIENDYLFFAFLVGAITIVFFSIASTKLPNYPMPSYPFIAILLGYYWCDLLNRQQRKSSLFISLAFLAVISLVLPIGAYIALGQVKQLIEVRNVSWLLSVVSIGAAIGLYFYYRIKLKNAFLTIASSWILLGFLLFGCIYPILMRQSPVALASKFLNNETEAVVFKRFDSAFPINFNRTYRVFQRFEALKAHLEQHPKSYIITNTRNKEDLELLSEFELVMEQKALFENHTTRIYKK